MDSALSYRIHFLCPVPKLDEINKLFIERFFNFSIYNSNLN